MSEREQELQAALEQMRKCRDNALDDLGDWMEVAGKMYAALGEVRLHSDFVSERIYLMIVGAMAAHDDLKGKRHGKPK